MKTNSALAKSSSLLRVLCLTSWLLIILAGGISYLAYPEFFTAQNIAAFLLRFDGEIWLVYLGLSIVRGFTLLPSTPLVITGTMLYPQQPFLVLFISILGILISSAMIYFFSDLLGFSDYFERKHPKFIDKTKQRLEKSSGVAFVCFWAFCPFVPTDAVCYVAGTSKMNFLKFIAAVFVGELVLCIFYIFSGSYLLTH